MRYYPFTCPFENCYYHKRITEATQNEIKSHFKKHDFTELLQKAVRFRFIETVSERRHPDWLARKFFEYSTNEVNQIWF